MHFGTISGTDALHAFTEAIQAEKSNIELFYEVGMRAKPLRMPLSEDHETPWSSDTRFPHFLSGPSS